jgi:hypothetical protein
VAELKYVLMPVTSQNHSHNTESRLTFGNASLLVENLSSCLQCKKSQNIQTYNLPIVLYGCMTEKSEFVGARGFSGDHNFQTGSGVHAASYPMGAGSKAAGA